MIRFFLGTALDRLFIGDDLAVTLDLFGKIGLELLDQLLELLAVYGNIRTGKEHGLAALDQFLHLLDGAFDLAV